MVYDFEARMEKMQILCDNNKQSKTTNQHLPVMVSFNPNVEGHDKAYFIYN